MGTSGSAWLGSPPPLSTPDSSVASSQVPQPGNSITVSPSCPPSLAPTSFICFPIPKALILLLTLSFKLISLPASHFGGMQTFINKLQENLSKRQIWSNHLQPLLINMTPYTGHRPKAVWILPISHFCSFFILQGSSVSPCPQPPCFLTVLASPHVPIFLLSPYNWISTLQPQPVPGGHFLPQDHPLKGKKIKCFWVT